VRFLLLTTSYPSPARPISGTFNRSLAEALNDEHEVKVVAPIPWPAAFRAAVRGVDSPPTTTTPRTAIEVLHPLYLYTPWIFRNQHGRFMRASIRGHLRSLFARFRPDAVIGYWAHPDGEAAVAAARENDAVALVVVGGSDVLLLARNASRRPAISRVLRSADGVLAVGSALRERVIEMGVPAERVHVFEQGVDLTLFAPADRGTARRRLGLHEDHRIILWVGRMVEVKALDVLIAAGARLRARGVDFQLYLVGDGPLAGRVRSWIQGANCEGVMHVVGPVDHAQLPDWYRAADLTVLPSHSEGIPNVLLESLACGTPFVATSVGGVPEIAREPSELVPPGDPEALAAAIAQRLSSGRASGEAIAQISWADTASSVAALVRSLREDNGERLRRG
jgi:glycosyltransferase involved in cell wall biosynthesis